MRCRAPTSSIDGFSVFNFRIDSCSSCQSIIIHTAVVGRQLVIDEQENYRNDDTGTGQNQSSAHGFLAQHQQTTDSEKSQSDSVEISHPGPTAFGVIEMQEVEWIPE